MGNNFLDTQNAQFLLVKMKVTDISGRFMKIANFYAQDLCRNVQFSRVLQFKPSAPRSHSPSYNCSRERIFWYASGQATKRDYQPKDLIWSVLPIFQPPNWVTATTFCGPLLKRYEHTGHLPDNSWCFDV